MRTVAAKIPIIARRRMPRCRRGAQPSVVIGRCTFCTRHAVTKITVSEDHGGVGGVSRPWKKWLVTMNTITS